LFREYWDERARKYGVSAPSNIASEEAIKQWTALFQEIFDKVSDCEELLDIGCGLGRLYDVLSRHCRHYTGVDFSQEMLARFPSLRTGDHIYWVETAAELPFQDAEFDAVVSSVFLQHVVDHKEFLKVVSEIKRVLKPEGTLYLCEAMLEGIPLHQPFDYQRIRHLKMYQRIFEPEIMLKDKGEVAPAHHFLTGQRKKVLVDESQIRVDVGSGKGKVRDAIGIDTRIIYSYGRRITDILADARKLPFKNSSIDKLWCRNLLEHFENPYLIILEVWRILKDDGEVVIEVPYPGTASAEGDPTHKFIQDAGGWIDILAGFFEKIVCMPLGLRYQGVSSKWIDWQRDAMKDGFYEMAQGGRFICSVPRDIPFFKYVPWWLEEYVKSIVGNDLV